MLCVELEQSSALFSDLAERPDHYVLDSSRFLPRLLLPDDCSRIDLAANERDFQYLLHGLARRAEASGGPICGTEGSIDIAATLRHERSHANAALMAGFRVTRYYLRSTEVIKMTSSGLIQSTSIDFTAGVIPLLPERKITKLALASTVAAPYNLSLGDNYQLDAMGYEGTDDVAVRILDHNRANPGSRLMVPLGFNLAAPRQMVTL